MRICLGLLNLVPFFCVPLFCVVEALRPTRAIRLIKSLPVVDPVFRRYIRIQHATHPAIQKLTRLDPMDPVFHRYLRIQHSANPMVRELYNHIRGRLVSSFIPESVLQDTVYECAEANQIDVKYFVQHLVLQIISHQIADYIHDAIT